MYTGITSAFFKFPYKALFIMFEITGAICKEACFSNFAGIWTHPVAFFGFSFGEVYEQMKCNRGQLYTAKMCARNVKFV